MDDQQSKLVIILRADAEMYSLDPDLAQAHAIVETNLNAFCCRHEKNWNWYFKAAEFARKLGQTEDTESIQQATSWGCLQIMGSVARELGFAGYLSQLALPAVGVRYGILKMQELHKRYPKLEDCIASYNAGSPRMAGDAYSNQPYVNHVLAELKKLKG